MSELNLDKQPITLHESRARRSRFTLLLGIILTLLIVVAAVRWQQATSTSQSPPPVVAGERMPSYETRADASVRVTNPNGQASDQNPAFLDDQTVVYTRFRDGYNSGPAALMKLDLTSGHEEIVWQDEAMNVSVNGNPFTPDHSQICYSSDIEDTDEIWCLNFVSKERQRITDQRPPTRQFFEPSVRYDGQRIAFEVHEESNTDSPGQILLTDLTGTTEPLITDGDVRLPMFHPSDGRLLFQRGVEDYFELVIRQPDGSQQVLPLLTQGGTDATWAGPAEIVYSGEDESLTHPNIFSFDLNTDRGERETAEAAMEDGAPAVSLNGRWLIFESHTDESSPSRLWVRDRLQAVPDLYTD